MFDQLAETVQFLRNRGFEQPEVGVILGTGLGNTFVKKIEVEAIISYDEIPHFPVATVEFHHGKLIYGSLHGKKIIAMQGRFHYYEGYDLSRVTYPVRVMKQLGISALLISNAAGNLRKEWSKGEIMLLDDHINLLPDNPLRGRNDERLGMRFPDMSAPYSPVLNEKMEEAARKNNITLRKGVYVAVSGPNLETRAEYRFMQIIGADAVGMSTVPEVIVANHMNLPCAALSVLTDDCDPDNLQPANIEEIIRIAGMAETDMTEIFSDCIRLL
jgi:purine-nucleoside phosphorylase